MLQLGATDKMLAFVLSGHCAGIVATGKDTYVWAVVEVPSRVKGSCVFVMIVWLLRMPVSGTTPGRSSSR